MNQDNTQRQKGFTLIELMLAMTFISILLLTIALTIVQIATIYNRGIISRELNQVSRSINEELDLAMRTSGTFDATSPSRFVTQTSGGRLCMGQYSYIWNYGALSYTNTNRNKYLAATPNTSGNKIIDSSGTAHYEITFVKVPDAGGTYCVATSGVYPDIKGTGATELIRTGDHALGIHSFVISTPPPASIDALSAQRIYKISYVLGTTNTAAINTTPTIACKAPGAPGADSNYCAVQKFTIVLRVVSGVN